MLPSRNTNKLKEKNGSEVMRKGNKEGKRKYGYMKTNLFKVKWTYKNK